MCNCEGNTYHLNMGCCVPVVANADAYYTKSEVDKKIDDVVIEAGAVTPTAVQNMIDTSLVDYALKEEIPSLNGYATEQWVEDKNYLTEHQSLEGYVTENDLTAYTYDKATISNMIAEGGGFVPSDYYNKTATNALLAEKADTATTYSKTEVNSLIGNKVDVSALSSYYTKGQADLIFALKEEIPSLNGYATEQWVENKGYLTEHQSLANYALKSEIPTDFYTKAQVDSLIDNKADYEDLGDFYTKEESDELYALKSEIPNINGKQDISGMTAYTQTTAFTQHTSDTNVHVTSSEKAAWNNKSDFSGSYNDLTNKPTIPTIWHGTKAQYDAITTKDPNTVYLIYES